VGRTGAGKSSLIAALFRLAPTDGEILIDGITCSEFPLAFMRSSIGVIPQDPVLFRLVLLLLVMFLRPYSVARFGRILTLLMKPKTLRYGLH